MARQFSKNTSNYMLLGSAVSAVGGNINGAAFISMHAHVLFHSITTTNVDNRIFQCYIDTANAGLILSVHDGVNPVLLVSARSVGTDVRQVKSSTSICSTNHWYRLGAVIDIGGDAITPYFNGIADGGGAVTFGNATYTQGGPTAGRLDSIGSSIALSVPESTGTQVDGVIGEVAIWAGARALTPGEMKLLGAGYPALSVAPDILKLFWLNKREKLVQQRTGTNNNLGVLTGSVPQVEHPQVRFIHPGFRRRNMIPNAAGPGRISRTSDLSGLGGAGQQCFNPNLGL